MEKGKNWKLETSLFPLFCVVCGKRKWIKKRDFGQFQNLNLKFEIELLSLSGVCPVSPVF